MNQKKTIKSGLLVQPQQKIDIAQNYADRDQYKYALSYLDDGESLFQVFLISDRLSLNL